MRHSSDVKIPSLASTFVVSRIESVHRIKKSLLFITKKSRLGSEDHVVLPGVIASDDNSEG